jgi:hypothetical protein
VSGFAPPSGCVSSQPILPGTILHSIVPIGTSSRRNPIDSKPRASTGWAAVVDVTPIGGFASASAPCVAEALSALAWVDPPVGNVGTMDRDRLYGYQPS